MVSKKYLEKLREEVTSKLKLSTKEIVVSSSSSKEDIAYYSSLNSSYFKKLREKLIAKLTEEDLEVVEECLDEYTEICSDFANSNFYYIDSTLCILEKLLNINFNIEFRN